MPLKAYKTGFPACCGVNILSNFGGGYAVPKRADTLYISILTEAQRTRFGKELEDMGYECVKIFRTTHNDPYNLYLYVSPRADKDNVINNPAGTFPLPKETAPPTPIRDAFGRFMKKRFMEKGA